MQLKRIIGAACLAFALPSISAEVTYRADVAPMMKKYCAECHAAPGAPSMAEFKLNEEKYKKAESGPRTDTYEDLVILIAYPSTGAFMRRLDDGTSPYSGGKPGNMYKTLGDTDAERAANLAVLKAWVGEGGWNLNRMAARGDVPAVTKEQLDKLKLKY